MLRILNPSKLLLITNQSNRKLLLFLYFQIQPRFLSDSVTPPILVPNHQQISQLILEQKSPHQALQTFQWATKIPTFTHTPSTYRALIHKLCTFRHFDIVENLLDEMPSSIGLYPDDDIFVTIVRGFGRAGMIKEVIGVLELVSKYGTGAPSLKVLNSILDVLVKEDIDIAREFYRKKMMGSGDDYTYGILMKGFCLTNRIGDGFKLLQVMKNHEVKPNVVVYNTLIHALCKNGKVGRARSLMNEMREFSDVTFNTLISAYCNENNLVQVLVMMDKCFGYGFVPDVVTFTKAVEVLCNAGRISDAVEVFDRVEGNGGTIDVVAHNTLIKGFVKAGKVKAGRGFIKQMEMKGCLPNTETYNILIAGFCDSGMLDSALDMFHEMKRVGVNCNFATFDTLIYGLCSCGRTRDGLKIFELMSECRESFAHIDPYNSILYGFYKENCLDNALEFLNDMRNMFPRAVDKSLRILQLTEEGNTDEAKNVLESMKEVGCIPNALIYASLVPGFCRKGCMKEAVELTNEMIELRYFPTASTFNALFDGFCQRGKAGIALRLMEDLKMRSILPDSESYSIIINGFCSEKDMNQALMLLMDMIERGFVPDNSLWNVMIVVMLEGNTMLQEHKLLLSLI